jgi:hypothetical protein
MPEVVAFAMKVNAKAAYCFAIDGDKGTGGCPVVMGVPPHEEYLARCRELIAMLRRSADLLLHRLDRYAQDDPCIVETWF